MKRCLSKGLIVVVLVSVAVCLRAEENLVILPGAASAAGVGGTHWLSDVEVLNIGNTSLELTARFLPFGSTNSSQAVFSVDAGELRVLSDIVGELGRADSGTIELSSSHPFLAGMRTYNQSDSGSFGQFIPSESSLIQGVMQDVGGEFLPGILENGSYRCNFGVYNRADTSVSFSVDGISKSLGAHSGWQKRITQIENVDGEGDTLRIGGDPVISYLSVIDHQTGDPTFIPPRDREVSGSLVGVAHQSGSLGSQWRSDLFVHAEEATTVLMSFLPWGDASGPGITLELAEGETRVFPDIVALMTTDDGGGVLSYTATHPISVSARTYNQSDEGTFGQGILPTRYMEEGIFLFLREDADFRSNLALYNPTETQQDYSLRAYSDQAELLGENKVSIPAQSALQFNHVIRRFGLQQLAAGYLEVSGGLFGGYLSFIDNSSGDASTVLPLSPRPEARISGASVFGKLSSFGGDAAEARISIIDGADWSLVARPLPDHEGRFSADLPGSGEYWIIAGTPSASSGARWVDVGDAPVEANIMLLPVETAKKAAHTFDRDASKDQIGVGTVSIVVLDACTDEGIAHADVRLVNVTTGLIVASEETRADGRVTFNDVPVDDSDTAGGQLSLYMAFAGGWALNDYKACHYGRVLLGVGDIREMEIMMMPIEDQQSCYGSVSGTVIDHCAGEPLSMAEIRVMNGTGADGCDDDMGSSETAFSDTNGHYSLDKVVPGVVQIFVGEPSIEESLGECLACYWAEVGNLEIEKAQNSNLDFDLNRKGIVFLGQVRDREYGDPVSDAQANFVNVNPKASRHGPLYTNGDGIFIFNNQTGPVFQGVTSGTLEVHLTDSEDESCTSDKSFDICDWQYDEQLILSCGETWSGSYTTTISYSETFGDATLTKNGTAHGEFQFSVDTEGHISGSAQDDQLITATTPGCTTTWDGAGSFDITGETIEDRYRLFFDDEESFVYLVKTVCEGAPALTETQTGAAELQYAPMIEVEKSEDGRSIHFEETHRVEHIGTYTIVLDATRN